MISIAILSIVSFTSIAEPSSTQQDNEPEKFSFYGGRAVPHVPVSDAQTQTTSSPASSSSNNSASQRRAIHPILPTNNSPELLNTQVTKQQLQLSVTNAIKITIPPPETIILSDSDKGIITSSNDTRITTKQLTREDLVLAKKAQYYIERNWNKNTGLIDSVQGYHHATLWDMASGIGAILALENLELISHFDASSRLTKTLKTLFKLPLYNNELPNREYNTQSGLPSGSLSKTASNGNGWSALDIGRLLIWLEITKQYKPELTPLITLITKKWKFERTVFNQTLYGELKQKRSTSYRQEGRLGYLQYAAQGYQFSGFDVENAFKQDNTTEIMQEGIPLHIDQRNLPFFTSDSYVLQAIELGSPIVWWNQLENVYQLHKTHYSDTKVLRIFAEDAMNKAPWFSYNNINIYGKSWLSTNTRGKSITNPQIFSNKVAFAFSVLFDDAFSQQLATQVLSNSLSQRSVPTGLYQDGSTNTAYNINTNSLILVALWFKSRDNMSIYQATDNRLNKVVNKVVNESSNSDLTPLIENK
jgi:hypothetical protein